MVLSVVLLQLGAAPVAANQVDGIRTTPLDGPSTPANNGPYQQPTSQGRHPIQSKWTTPLGQGDARQEAEAIPLPGPSRQEGAARAPAKADDTQNTVTTVLGSLAVVLGLFFLVVFLTKRTAPKGSRVLPEEVFQVLGRAPLGNRQQAQLVRVGNKLVLLSISSQSVDTLTEITDPDEVQHLASLCHGGIRDSFRDVLTEMGDEPASGFLGDESDHVEVANRGARRNRQFEQWG